MGLTVLVRLTPVHLKPFSCHLLTEGVGRAVGGSAAQDGALLHRFDTSMHTAYSEAGRTLGPESDWIDALRLLGL